MSRARQLADSADLSFDGSTLVVDEANNRVGIGTSSPSRELDIGGTTSAYMAFSPSSENQFVIGVDGYGFVVYDDTVNAYRLMVSESGDLQFNSGYGSVATAYGCRAWVNFNGTGTVAIRDSGNVSSITDNGTGDYTVNFTTAMPDVNFCAVGSQSDDSTANAGVEVNPATTTTIIVRTKNFSNNTNVDALEVSIAVFR